jgi:hypothetical protein
MKELISTTAQPATAALIEEANGSLRGRKLSRADFLRIAGAAGLGIGAVIVGTKLTPARTAAKKAKMDTPILSCGQVALGYIDIQVCAPAGADASGLPAGFSIQMMTESELIANGGWYESDDPRLCKTSFSGEAFASRYDLTPGACVTVRMGDLLLDNGVSTNCADPLVCDTTYVFRAFGHAHNTRNRSDFTADLFCTTATCGGVTCTSPWCVWAQNFPASAGCDIQPAVDYPWPVNSLTLGSINYSICELISILNSNLFSTDNALILIAREQIAAKLNIARGADGSVVTQAMSDADALIGSLVIPPVGDGFIATTASTTALIESLKDYNYGRTGPGACPDGPAQCDLD